MNRKTLTALKGSIKKWESVAAGESGDHSIDDCPLCAIFFGNLGCDGCPVSERTGKSACRNTPYEKWTRLTHHQMSGNGAGRWAETTAQIEMAQEEVKFLKSLLPGEKH